jgi:CheY-like chemotaxis protein
MSVAAAESIDFQTVPVPILLIEDDALEVEIIREVLKSANLSNPMYRVCDGVEALEVLKGHIARMKLPQPCVILLDINMPRMNGFELLDKMRADEQMKKNVIFILTTSSREEDKIRAYESGVAGYVLKRNLGDLASMLRIYCRINEFPH